MKLLLMMRGIVSVVALVAAAQTPPVTQPVAQPATAGNVADSVVKTPENTKNPYLEFQPGPEKAPVPPPAVVPKTKKEESAAVPVALPGGPQVLDAPTGPAAPVVPARPQDRPAVMTGGKQSKPYVIGPLDVLEVKVWNDAKLSGLVDVATDGTISMPLIGLVNASGLTGAELVAELKNKLAAVLIEPEVNVQVVRINSKKYSIFGGCLRQGEFPLVGDVTVLDAFANCGGFKDFADLKKIYVLRGSQRLKFNYKDVIRGKHMEQNIPLENGDRIVIPE